MTVRARPRRPSQRPHHDQLLRQMPWRPEGRPAGGPLDAIVVPAGRPAHHLQEVMRLAADSRARIVVLVSHGCDFDEAVSQAARTERSRAVVVQVPADYRPPALDLVTSSSAFRGLNGGRASNLSLKRNLGLVLARLLGWRKIMFLDDDIVGMTPDHVARIGLQLETRPFAGFKTTYFYDNSVVCHANRLSGERQGIFVSGAALGVQTADLPLEFFPDVYNEDWFFLAQQASTHGVPHVGDIRQLEFNPFKDPRRAVHEEFGDLIAEGLYALFNDGCGLSRATLAYWRDFRDQRHQLVGQIIQRLVPKETNESIQAQNSLLHAQRQLESIEPEACVSFVDAWQHDRSRFATLTARLHGVRDYDEAFAFLGLPQWREVRFGVAEMPRDAEIIPRGSRR